MPDRVRIGLVVLGALALFVGAGCSRPYVIDGPRTAALATGPDLARASILRGLAARGFHVEAEYPGVVIAGYERADVWLRIEISYDGASYAIAYRESLGLDERPLDDGRTRIDRRYAGWIDALALEIERASRLPDTLATAPPRTSGGEVAAGAPADAAPVSPPSTTALASPYVVAGTPAVSAGSPYEPVAPPEPRATRLLEEVLIPGVILWGGSWVANWATTLAISSEGPMIGLSFVPIIGPFCQLIFLDWTLYQRWTGLYFPLMGLVQVAGLIMTVVGATVHVPTDAPASSLSLRVVPFASPEAAGLTLDASF